MSKKPNKDAERASAIFHQEYGEEINSLAKAAYVDIVEKINAGEVFEARERFKTISAEADPFIAEQAMAKILCELYTQRRRNYHKTNIENTTFNLESSMENVGYFLSEIHSIYRQQMHHRKSAVPTLGNKAKIILDGLEDSGRYEEGREQAQY